MLNLFKKKTPEINTLTPEWRSYIDSIANETTARDLIKPAIFLIVITGLFWVVK